MKYFIAFFAFITTFLAAILLFGELIPPRHTQWMKAKIWGREIGGMVVFVIALAAAVGVLRLLS